MVYLTRAFVLRIAAPLSGGSATVLLLLRKPGRLSETAGVGSRCKNPHDLAVKRVGVDAWFHTTRRVSETVTLSLFGPEPE